MPRLCFWTSSQTVMWCATLQSALESIVYGEASCRLVNKIAARFGSESPLAGRLRAEPIDYGEDLRSQSQ